LVVGEVEVDLAGQRGGRPLAMLLEAGRERDEVAGGVEDRLGYRELPREGVAPAAVTDNGEAGLPGPLERIPHVAGAAPGPEPAVVRGREVQRPVLVGRRDVDFHAEGDRTTFQGDGVDGAVARSEVVGLPLADVVARLAVHRQEGLARDGR